jgi:hypothetical protein
VLAAEVARGQIVLYANECEEAEVVLMRPPAACVDRIYYADSGKQKAQSQGLGFLLDSFGAGKRNRTPDLRITNALLYRLSYSGIREGRL